MLEDFGIRNTDVIESAAQRLVDDPPAGWDPRGPDDKVLTETLAGII
jgi:hypothetical protein